MSRTTRRPAAPFSDPAAARAALDGGPVPRPDWVAKELGSPTGRGLRVGIIDSGWDRSLAEPRVLPGIGLVDAADELALGRSDDDRDRHGHGTACADQVLRIAPEVQIVPIRVFGRDLETSPSVLYEALRWAVEQELDVINVSLGTNLPEALHPLYVLCEKARRGGMLIVAAGHNVRDWSYPAVFENVIGVDADRFDSPFAYRYRPDEAMECVAWGVEVPVLWLGGERLPRSGTSFAAPQISGIVSLFRERYPSATLEDVRELLARYAAETEAPAPGSDATGGVSADG